MRPSAAIVSLSAITSVTNALTPENQHTKRSAMPKKDSPTKDRSLLSLPKRSAADPTWRIEGCMTKQRQILEDTHRSAEVLVQYTLPRHDEGVSKPGSLVRRTLELYFGKDLTEEQLAFITDKLHRLPSSLKHTSYTCDFRKDKCPSFAVSFVSNGVPDYDTMSEPENAQVFLCPKYFDPEQFSAERPRATAYQIEALIHEQVHTLGVTEAPRGFIMDMQYPPASAPNLAYGKQNTQQIAAWSSEAAIMSADNYIQYILALGKAYRSGDPIEAEEIDHGPAPAWTTLWNDDLRTPATATPATVSTTPAEHVRISSGSSSSLPRVTPTESVPSESFTDTSYLDEPTSGDRLNQAMGLTPEKVDHAASRASSICASHITKWWLGGYGLAATVGFMAWM